MSQDHAFDRRNLDWYIDKAVQVLVFMGGISAIIFIVGIFLFITKEGIGFLIDTLDFQEFSAHPTGNPVMRMRRNMAFWP